MEVGESRVERLDQPARRLYGGLRCSTANYRLRRERMVMEKGGRKRKR